MAPNLFQTQRFYQELRRNRHPLVDKTRVTLYATAAWPAQGRPFQLLPPAETARPPISLIATVRNEAVNIERWLDSLLEQTLRPAEIVIVDGGSSDGTYEILQAFAARSPVPVKILQEAGANIARGRNLAIERAAGPLIACTDAGCLVPPAWLAHLTGPFAADSEVEVVAGYYEASWQSELQRVMSIYFVTPPEMIDPQTFLPSARSIAFRKLVWQAAGGFPEWLTLTGEDTLFDLVLKEQTTRWAFVPEAVVYWYLKPTLAQLFKQVRAYGRGDGEAGLFAEDYWKRLLLWLGLGGTALLILAIIVPDALYFHNWFLLLLAIVPAWWLLKRLWRMTLRPTWPQTPWQKMRMLFLSTLVVCTISLALTLGFIEGVRLRLKKETR